LPVHLADGLELNTGPAPKASGTLESHYAPTARVRLVAAEDLPSALEARSRQTPVMPVALWWRSQPRPDLGPGVVVQAMPQAADACAHDLFAQLRAFDAQGVQEIWIEPPPAGEAWDGVRDRLRRAAH
jgi:L-threonylcarbamoyladenylate synthase